MLVLWKNKNYFRRNYMQARRAARELALILFYNPLVYVFDYYEKDVPRRV